MKKTTATVLAEIIPQFNKSKNRKFLSHTRNATFGK